MDVPPRLHPQSQLSQKFFGDIDLEEQLGERYELVEGRDSAFSPYARLVYDQIKEREALIQFLPSYLTLPIAHSTYAIKGMSQVNEQSHPHVIQCRGFWQQDELVCIAEEAHNGFALSFLLADRGNLDPPEVLILLRQLVEAYDEAVALDMLPKCLSLHSLEVHFPNESRLRVRDFRKRQVDVWPAFRLKLRCHAILDSSVRLPPWGRLQARGEPSPEWLAKCDFVGIAEELVLGEQPPPPMAPEATNSLPEHVVELRKFFEEQYRSIAADPADYSFADLIENLGTQLARLRPRESVEVVGTIVDGAIALADAATKKTAGSRRGVASGAPRPMTASNEESGVDGARDSELNPIARGLQGAPQPGEENAEEDAVSLGTIDDGDFDIGDSREADPSLPKNLPQGVNREEDEGSSTAPEKPARRKGWFFLR